MISRTITVVHFTHVSMNQIENVNKALIRTVQVQQMRSYLFCMMSVCLLASHYGYFGRRMYPCFVSLYSRAQSCFRPILWGGPFFCPSIAASWLHQNEDQFGSVFCYFLPQYENVQYSNVRSVAENGPRPATTGHFSWKLRCISSTVSTLPFLLLYLIIRLAVSEKNRELFSRFKICFLGIYSRKAHRFPDGNSCQSMVIVLCSQYSRKRVCRCALKSSRIGANLSFLIPEFLRAR